MSSHKRLILFTRYPVPGKVKTRLVPTLGRDGAAGLHRRLVLRTLRTARKTCEALEVELEVCFDGGSDDAMRHWLGDAGRFTGQRGADLGERMATAFDCSFREGSAATIIIGSDCPGLTARILVDAFKCLSEVPVVLGPANDGGYYLIGLTRLLPELFRGVPWGTEGVLPHSVKILDQKGLQARLMNPLDDLDRPQDLAAWRRINELEESDLSRVSVVVPALNEEEQIARTLNCVQQCQPHEVIVVDGGSTDGTMRLAREGGAKVLKSKPCRARQMNAGATQAEGHALLFLHADTLLPREWLGVIVGILRRPGIAAGAFGFRIGGEFHGRTVIERAVRFRSKCFQRPYGDQGLYVSRALFEEVGGFADLPVLEDYELVSRLRRRGRIITAAEAATTSGRRWHRLGFWRTTLINQLVLAGYHLGVRPERLARLYRDLAND
jgi:rSAM/selenodomain-associated transferase 2/rSAM/selenodomain-associated transferase 1